MSPYDSQNLARLARHVRRPLWFPIDVSLLVDDLADWHGRHIVGPIKRPEWVTTGDDDAMRKIQWCLAIARQKKIIEHFQARVDRAEVAEWCAGIMQETDDSLV
jgi:hypothetical protein